MAKCKGLLVTTISSPGRFHGRTSGVDGALARGWRPSWRRARLGRDGTVGGERLVRNDDDNDEVLMTRPYDITTTTSAAAQTKNTERAKTAIYLRLRRLRLGRRDFHWTKTEENRRTATLRSWYSSAVFVLEPRHCRVCVLRRREIENLKEVFVSTRREETPPDPETLERFARSTGDAEVLAQIYSSIVRPSCSAVSTTAAAVAVAVTSRAFVHAPQSSSHYS